MITKVTLALVLLLVSMGLSLAQDYKEESVEQLLRNLERKTAAAATNANGRNARCDQMRLDLIKSNSYFKIMIEVGNALSFYRAGAKNLIKDGALVKIGDGRWQHVALYTATEIAANRVNGAIKKKIADAHDLIDQAADLAVAACEQAESIEDENKAREDYELIGHGVAFHFGKGVGKDISDVLSEVLADRTTLEKSMVYPNYAIDLCYEDCGELCYTDFFEIAWLKNPTAESILEQHSTLVGLAFAGTELGNEFVWNFYETVFGQIVNPLDGKEARLSELVTFAGNVESWCAGTCKREQIQQWNNRCCYYTTCESFEKDELSFCGIWGEKDVLRHWTLVGPDECPIQGASSQDYESYSYDGYDDQCFANDIEAECSMSRKYVGVDGAEYCGGDWSGSFFCLKGPVGYRATLFQNACNQYGLQTTSERKGSYCQVMMDLDCIVNVDKALVTRCPGRFTDEKRSP